MNKQELIALVAEENKMSKAQAGRVVDSIFTNIVKAVAQGDTFRLLGFGNFKAIKREARVSHNPRTGEVINAPAAVVPKFVPGKAFKGAVAK